MNIEELLAEHGIKTAHEGEHHHARAGWLQMDCPWCGRDSGKFHLGFNIESGYFNCYRCGPHQAVNTIFELTGIPYRDASAILRESTRSTPIERERVSGKLKLPSGLRSPMPKPHRKYLSSRGFSPSRLERIWRLSGTMQDSDFAWRIVIPIHLHGETVSWTTRSISRNPDSKRYISASPDRESVHHKDILYGEDFCRHAIVVCEGPTDVWRIGPGAVCTFGTNYTVSQIRRIGKYPKRMILFDSEPTAKIQSEKLAAELNSFPGETFVGRIKSAKDPGSATDREIESIRKFLQ